MKTAAKSILAGLPPLVQPSAAMLEAELRTPVLDALDQLLDANRLRDANGPHDATADPASDTAVAAPVPAIAPVPARDLHRLVDAMTMGRKLEGGTPGRVRAFVRAYRRVVAAIAARGGASGVPDGGDPPLPIAAWHERLRAEWYWLRIEITEADPIEQADPIEGKREADPKKPIRWRALQGGHSLASRRA